MPPVTTATGESDPDPDGQTLNGIRIQPGSLARNEPGRARRPKIQLPSRVTLTRIHSTVAAVGGVGRGLAIARAYSLVREVGVGDKCRMKLLDSPLHMRTLAKLSAEYHRLMLVTFYVSYILGVSEHGPISPHASYVLQILTPPERRRSSSSRFFELWHSSQRHMSARPA
ncbi:hypothetical protein E4U58_005841 [Claviceps cyperi]|nr:hypothetical protein E4U58_005841 [Claviceps cyperi]